MNNAKIRIILRTAMYAAIPIICAVWGVRSMLEGKGPGGLLGTLWTAGIMVWLWRTHEKLYATKKLGKERNFDWYRATYSSHFHNGRVTCHKCGGDRIHSRSLLRHTFTREHFCTQCGETLYYSPEASPTV